MKLLIKQRVFSWSDSVDIYDENGNVVYFVKAEIISLGHRLHVYDKYDREIGLVREHFVALLPTFDIVVNGEEVGTIKKKLSFLYPKYEIDFNGWQVEGNFLGWDYDVYDRTRHVLHISKELFRWGDTYVLDIADPRDEIMGLMLVIAIDAANCNN